MKCIAKIKTNGVVMEKIFPKQMEIPSKSRNILRYMGLRVQEKTPSVIKEEDSFISRVVWCFLNRSRAFPMIENPVIAINRPTRLWEKESNCNQEINNKLLL
jgi:hypothetical protein